MKCLFKTHCAVSVKVLVVLVPYPFNMKDRNVYKVKVVTLSFNLRVTASTSDEP